MKHTINTICLLAVLSVMGGAAIFLSACSRGTAPAAAATAGDLFMEADSVLLHADEAGDTIEIRYARGLAVSYEADGVHVRISNPESAGRDASSAPPPCSSATSRCWGWKSASWA